MVIRPCGYPQIRSCWQNHDPNKYKNKSEMWEQHLCDLGSFRLDWPGNWANEEILMHEEKGKSDRIILGSALATISIK